MEQPTRNIDAGRAGEGGCYKGMAVTVGETLLRVGLKRESNW